MTVTVITSQVLDSTTITAWITEMASVVHANRDHLVQLDAAIGDGDHGINMDRGMAAAQAALAEEPEAAPGRKLTLTGKTLISTVGGASGPLYGTFFRRAGRELGDSATVDAVALLAALDAALAAVQDLGAAAPGDKTMVDALQPALAALRTAIERGEPLAVALHAAADAAEAGMRATVPLQARRGRASYLGERSVGHQDPGATSSALLLRALQRVVAGRS